MSFVTLSILSSLAISMVALAILLANALRVNFQTGKHYRLQYVEKVSALRFGKILQKRDADLQKILHSHSIAKIENQISNCLACKNTETCDRSLDEPVSSAKDLAFCSNRAFIAEQI